MEDGENMEEIEGKIKKLKNERRNIQRELKIKERNKNGKLRLKSDNNGNSNILKRVSNNFSRKLDFINNKREENGLDKLSNPKITELIVKHKTAWRKIQDDIIIFNTSLELDSEEKQEEVIYA